MPQMMRIVSSDSNLMLSYSVSTDPNPVQVSPPKGDPMKASLTVVINNPHVDPPTPVYVSMFGFRLPVGKDSASLVSPGTTFKASISPSELWQVSDPTEDGIVIIRPRSGESVEMDGRGVTVWLYDITVNQEVGTSQITIAEAATTNQPGPYYENNMTVAIGKFPYAFFAGDFHADQVEVKNGGTTTLHWVGSENAVYTLLWGSNVKDVTSVRSFNTPPLTNTTTFYLKVDHTHLGETVTEYFNLSVTVAAPNLTVSSLDVLDHTSLRGILEAENNVTLKQQLSVIGDTVLAALNAKTAQLSQDLYVKGNTLLQGADIQTLELRQKLILDGWATIGSDLTVKGKVQANALSVFGTSQSIEPNKSYVARSDGFVLGSIDGQGDTGKKSLGYIWGSCSTYGTIFATGGNTVSYVDPGVFSTDFVMSAVYSSFLLPVRMNDYFSVGTKIYSGSQTITFRWIPLGQSAPLAVADNEVKAIQDPFGEEPVTVISKDTPYGKAKLVNGKATVKFRADGPFEDHESSNAEPYQVMLTPVQNCNGMFVSYQGKDHFIVEELQGGTSDAEFNWAILR